MMFWSQASVIGNIRRNMEPLNRTSTLCETRMRACLGFRAGAMQMVLCVLVASCTTVPSAQKTRSLAPTLITTQQGLPAPAVTLPDLSKIDIAARDHIQNAMNALQVGQEAKAKIELDTVLRQDPENKVARSLLAQIQTDPAKYFGGQDAFSYTLQPGDSLSSIAQRFLNEPLKFHILARFNGITDPSRMAPGQTIKVPGKKAASDPDPAVGNDSRRAARVESTREPTRGGEVSHTQQARRLYDAGKYQQAIEILQGGGIGTTDARNLLVLSYGKYAEELTQNENLIDAQSVLESALSIQPGNDKLRKQLKHVEKQREIGRLYKTGTAFMVAGDSDKALDAFNALLKLEPKHEVARQSIASVTADTVEAMHKDAMVEYSKQNLDEAIALWDRALGLLPGHAAAKFYRARAVDLKSRLHKFDQKPAENTD